MAFKFIGTFAVQRPGKHPQFQNILVLAPEADKTEELLGYMESTLRQRLGLGPRVETRYISSDLLEWVDDDAVQQPEQAGQEIKAESAEDVNGDEAADKGGEDSTESAPSL